MMKVKKRTKLEPSMDKFAFQAKTERIDWKIISCIDIDAIIREGDVNKLEELINPVTFCKADAEFADSIPKSHGFIKVFRLSQLISEYLLASHEKYEDKVAALEEKYNASEKEKEKMSEELGQLKESLASARKELRRRKDMLTSNQNDLLGPNNTDEYDQCPYCSKRFLASGYLVAHMQRRHQGLPINPFYPSLPPGAPTCVHYQQHALTNLGPLTTGGNESVVNSNSSQQNVPTGQQQLPVVHTPTLLSNLLAPNNPSFSGSVTSLNQMFSNQMANTPSNDNLDRIDSFTQTSLLDDGVAQNYKNVTDCHQSFLKQIFHSKDFHNFPLNYFQHAHAVNPEILVGTLVEKYLEQKSSSTLSFQDGTRKRFPSEAENSPAETKDSSNSLSVISQNGSNKDDADDRTSNPRPHDGYVAGPASSKSREWVEAAELNVIQMQDKFNTQWQNLEEKVRQSGIEELKGAIIPEVAKVRELSTDLSSNVICEEGEVEKPPCEIHNQSSDKIKRYETEDLQQRLQEAIQDQIQPLISRLENQEQFWKDKLAFVQQDHEQQIQQLRQELVDNRSFSHVTSTDNLITKTETPTPDVNGVVVDDEKSEMNKKKDDATQSFHPAGVIVVGPKGLHNHANSKSLRRQHSFSASSPGTGAARDESSEMPIPVAKPRKSKTGSGLIQSSEPEDNSSALSPGLSEVPGIHHHQTHHDGSWKTTVQLESLSISEPEYLTIIQPEELLDKKHEHSIHTITRGVTNKNIPQMEIHSKRKNKSATWTDDINSDEVSDYSLSDSLVERGDDEHNTSNAANVENDSQQHPRQSIDHQRGKLSTKHTPVKKKNIIFDKQTRKLVEVSPDEEDEDDQSACMDLNSSDDNDNGDDRRTRKSQLDLVRAKTKMELEQQMTQIGLNPESRAIGLEEMGRALKHLKYQRRASTDQIHDVGKFEEERNAVKTFAKFEATKTSIDGKLDAISTLTSSKKASKNSFGKMLSAVKTSGKMFGKKVVSAVKKKPKPEKGVDENKSKKKSSPTLPLKTKFFSKSRWRRKKKGDADEKKKSVELQDDDDDHTCTDSESSEEVELSPYMTRSKPIHSNRRDSTRSLGKGNAFQRNGSRSRSHSRPKSAKPLKRLNNGNSSIPPSSTAASPPATLPSDRFNNNDRKENNSNNDTSSNQHSSASSPFSNVDEHENQSDFSHNDKDEVEYADNHTHQKQGKRMKENDASLKHHEMGNAVINELKKRFNRKAEGDKVHHTSRDKNPNELGKRETISDNSNEDETEEDWDAAPDNPRLNPNKSQSFNENNKSFGSEEDAFLTISGGNKFPKPNQGWIDVEHRGNARLVQACGEISDDRLHEIKQVISQSKKQMNSDTTSSSEDDLVDQKSNQQRRRSKGNRKSRESQEKLDERKVSSYSTKTNKDYNIDSHLNGFGKTATRQNHQIQQEPGRAVQNIFTSGSGTSTNPKYGAHPVAPTLASRHKTSAHISFANDGDEFGSDDSSFRDTALYSKEKAGIVGDFGYRQGQNSQNGSGARFALSSAAQGQTEIRRKLNSSEEIEEDVRDLLNATMSDIDELKFQGKPKMVSSTMSHPSSSAAARDLKSFRSTNSYNLQPTHNMDVMRQGSRTFASGLGTKNRLQSNERKSPSNNSWDSQK